MTIQPDLKPGIRWGRAIVGGLLIEIGLTLVAVPFFATGQTEATLLVIPPATIVVAALAGWWAARPAERALATGTLAGVVALLLYGVLVAVGMLLAPDQADTGMALSTPYLLSHVFKVLGGSLGGWWAARGRT